MNEQSTRNLRERLHELGLQVDEGLDLPDDGTRSLTLVHERGRARYRVGYTSPLTLSSARGTWEGDLHPGERLLLLGPRVTERSAERFRSLGIDYLDEGGNAFLSFGGVHIDVRGRAAVRAPRGESLPALRGGVNLFSPKRAQVIFAILSWPELLHGPLREIAAASGVSLGQAQETLTLLSEFDLLHERRRFLPGQRDLLVDRWSAAYPTGLGSAARADRLSGEWTGIDPHEVAVSLSGEAAVPELLRPSTAVIYTGEFPTELVRAHRWRRDDERPTILLRRRFWRSPGDADVDAGVHLAPWLLVYADLLASGDGRQRDAAEQLRERRG